MINKVHESEYGDSPNNFHVTKGDDTLCVTLTYPPYEDDPNPHLKARYVLVDQESVRASDGIRIHYDFSRDGYVVCQPKPRLTKISGTSYSDEIDWIEVGFFQSWRFNDRPDGTPTDAEWQAADAAYSGRTPPA